MFLLELLDEEDDDDDDEDEDEGGGGEEKDHDLKFEMFCFLTTTPELFVG